MRLDLEVLNNQDATMVAGFRAWQKLGRTVKKGEKGIGIFAPMPFKKKQDGESPQSGKSKSEPLTDLGPAGVALTWCTVHVVAMGTGVQKKTKT